MYIAQVEWPLALWPFTRLKTLVNRIFPSKFANVQTKALVHRIRLFTFSHHYSLPSFGSEALHSSTRSVVRRKNKSIFLLRFHIDQSSCWQFQSFVRFVQHWSELKCIIPNLLRRRETKEIPNTMEMVSNTAERSRPWHFTPYT